MAEHDKNTLIPLVEKLMDKQQKQNEKLKAEQFIELQTNKEEILEQVQKVTENVSNLQKNIDVVETKMAKNSMGANMVPLRQGIKQEMEKNGFLEKLEKWESRKGSNDFSIETPILRNQITITDPTSFIAGDAPVVLPFRDMGVDAPPKRPVLVSDIISWGTTTSNLVDWIERTGKTAGAAMRAEGGTMTQGDLEYTELSTKVKIASQFMKVTNESLKDVDFLASEINDELLTDLRLLVDDQLLAGDGVGNNLLGIIPQSQAFNPAPFAALIDEANNADVLRVAVNQILVAGQGKYMPNYILMHPTDVAELDLLKITDGRYIEIPFYDPVSGAVLRIPIIQNVGIPQGDYLVGDFMRAKAFLRDSLTIRIFDQNENDPIFNRSTVTSNIRLAFRIKTNDQQAFVTGDFATDKAALETP